MHEVRLLVSAIVNRNPHRRSAPATRKIRVRPCGKSAAPVWKIRSTRAENPRRSAQLSAGVRAEQPRNSSEKVKFSVSCTVRAVLRPCTPISNMHVCTPLHRLSKSDIKEGLCTCSAFLLNDFSRKRLSDGVTNCSIVMALNISLRTFSPCSSLTMSLRLAI